MTSNEDRNALYFTAWDNLSKMIRDIDASVSGTDIESLRTEVCSAATFVEELIPVIDIVEDDPEIRNSIVKHIKAALDSTDVASTKANLDTVADIMKSEWSSLPKSTKASEDIRETIDELSNKSAGVCRYIPKKE